MSFTKLCAIDFLSGTRRRGQQYEAEGRVHDLRVDEAGATATVEGAGGDYAVEIGFGFRNDGAVSLRCDCPHYSRGDLCKHIWAVLIALDKTCEVRTRNGRRIETIHQNMYDESGVIPEEEFPRGGAPFEVRGRNGTPLAARRPAGNWSHLFRTLARHIDDEPQSVPVPRRLASKEREVWYVLNVAESQLKDRLTIDLFQRLIRKDGHRSRAKRLTVSRAEISELPTEDDRWLAMTMAGADVTDGRYDTYQYLNYQSFSRCRLVAAMYDFLLPRLGATGRFVWLLDESMSLDDALPIRWDDGPPWQAQLNVETDDAAQRWRVCARLERAGQYRPVSDAVLLLNDGLVLFRDSLARMETGSCASWIRALARSGPMIVPFHERDAWLTNLLSLPQVPPLELPPSLQVERAAVEAVPHLKITRASPTRYAPPGELLLDLSFAYGEQKFDFGDPATGCYDAASNRYVVRHREREREYYERLLDLDCRPTALQFASDRNDLCVPERLLPGIVRTLVQEGWIVETHGARLRGARSIRLSVTSCVDWFELNGEVDFDGVAVSVPTLLAALRNKQFTVRLDDGTHGILPEEWLRKYGKLAELAEADGDVLTFKSSQALLLDALLAEQEHVEFDQSFAEFRERLKSFTGIQPADPPPTFCGELRAYQKEGLGWLKFLQDFRLGGCLADDMGLGKTIQVLALLELCRVQHAEARAGTGDGGLLARHNGNGRHQRGGKSQSTAAMHRPSIVVVPKSLVFNWLDEAQRFAPQLRLLNHTGIDRGDRFQATDEYDVLVTTYGTLRRDIVKLKEISFFYGILDEAQAIKNAGSQAAKACRLIKAQHRLAMTGTPVENHLGELWSLFEYLNPGMLGRSTVFASLAKTARDQDPAVLELLARAVRPLLLRRTKDQVLQDLPEKTEQTLYCELSTKERKAYDELRDFFRLQLAENVRVKGLAKSKIHVLEALLRLRQAACHSGLIDPKKAGEMSAKLETLLEQVGEIVQEGHKALVFSQFTSLLAIVRQHLDKRGLTYEYLDGQTRDRGARVKRFQEDPHCPLFLISLKAGGHGLNLTAADYVFILDPWWNPAVEAQAVDRAHRIGQSRRVFAYRLIARNTVEDKILELQKTKRELADAIITADSSLIRTLTPDDLDLLLS